MWTSKTLHSMYHNSSKSISYKIKSTTTHATLPLCMHKYAWLCTCVCVCVRTFWLEITKNKNNHTNKNIMYWFILSTIFQMSKNAWKIPQTESTVSNSVMCVIISIFLQNTYHLFPSEIDTSKKRYYTSKPSEW